MIEVETVKWKLLLLFLLLVSLTSPCLADTMVWRTGESNEERVIFFTRGYGTYLKFYYDLSLSQLGTDSPTHTYYKFYDVQMDSGATKSYVQFAVLQGNLTVTKLMENNVFEGTGQASAGSQSEFWIVVSGLEEPLQVQVNGVAIEKTSRWEDYDVASGDVWCYAGSGKVYAKGLASSDVPFSITWAEDSNGNGNGHPPPVGYHNLTAYVLYDNGTVIPYVETTLSTLHHHWIDFTDSNGTVFFNYLVEGEYQIGVLNQTKTVAIPFHDTVTFTFKSSIEEPSNLLEEYWFLIVIAGLAVATVIIWKKKKS